MPSAGILKAICAEVLKLVTAGLTGMQTIQSRTFIICVALALTAAPRASLAQTPTSPERRPEAEDGKELSDWLTFVLAAGGGGGFDSGSPRQATTYGGVKCGMPIAFDGNVPPKRLRTATLDLGYDRIRGDGGFSAELSLMLPIARFPKPQTDENKNYLRIYGEPGFGYRTGGERFGPYISAKVMLALFSDRRLSADTTPPSPYLEIQRRFPVTSALKGDTRVVIGVILAVCNHCGLQ